VFTEIAHGQTTMRSRFSIGALSRAGCRPLLNYSYSHSLDTPRTTSLPAVSSTVISAANDTALIEFRCPPELLGLLPIPFLPL